MNISEAETVRYAKIKNLICILQGRRDSAETDFLEMALPTLFIVGKKITVDGEEIRIGKKTYHSYEIKKVTINTEGSMALYDSCEKKIGGCFLLNASIENIELLCVWIKKNNIPVEVLSGKGERFFQYIIVFIVLAAAVLLKIMKIVRVW